MAKFDKNGKDTDNFFCAQVFNKDTDLFSPDMHRFYEILFFLSGNITYYIEDQACDIESGDILIIDMDTLHYPQKKKNARLNRIALDLDPKYVELLSTSDTDLTYCF